LAIIDTLPEIDLAVLVRIQMTLQHVGENRPDGRDIDWDEAGRSVHLLQFLPPSEKFSVDVADLFHQRLEFLVVGEGFHHVLLESVGDVVLLGSSSGIADREVVLGTMPGAVCTLASRLSAADVALDERAAENVRIDGGNSLEQGVSSGLQEQLRLCL
jgi:hypothetical protein